MKKKISTPYQFQEGHEKEIFSKMERYCAYTERCESDVLKKLKEWQVPYSLHAEVIEYLKDHRFIQNERFGQLFVNGKFKLKGWGKQKIKNHLQSKNIDEDIIISSLKNIEDKDYLLQLDKLMNLKRKSIKTEDTYELKGKLYRYAIQKGYESTLIMQWLDKNIH